MRQNEAALGEGAAHGKADKDVGGADRKADVAVGGADRRADEAIGGADRRADVAVGGADRRADVTVGGADRRAIGGADRRADEAVCGADRRADVAVGGADRRADEAVGGADRRADEAVGGADRRADEAVGGADRRADEAIAFPPGLDGEGADQHWEGEGAGEGWTHDNPALFAAVEANDPHALLLALKRGSNPNSPDSGGNTALHRASSLGHASLCRALLARGSDVNGRNDNQFTPLILAARANVDTVRTLLDLGACPALRNNLGEIPLHAASSAGLEDVMVELLTSAGSDVNSLSTQGLTPLYFAVGSGSIKAVEILMRFGAEVNLVFGPRVAPCASQTALPSLLPPPQSPGQASASSVPLPPSSCQAPQPSCLPSSGPTLQAAASCLPSSAPTHHAAAGRLQLQAGTSSLPSPHQPAASSPPSTESPHQAVDSSLPSPGSPHQTAVSCVQSPDCPLYQASASASDPQTPHPPGASGVPSSAVPCRCNVRVRVPGPQGVCQRGPWLHLPVPGGPGLVPRLPAHRREQPRDQRTVPRQAVLLPTVSEGAVRRLPPCSHPRPQDPLHQHQEGLRHQRGLASPPHSPGRDGEGASGDNDSTLPPHRSCKDDLAAIGGDDRLPPGPHASRSHNSILRLPAVDSGDSASPVHTIHRPLPDTETPPSLRPSPGRPSSPAPAHPHPCPRVGDDVVSTTGRPSPPCHGTTVLHRAAQLGSETMTRTLLVWGADVGARTGRGETALHLAAKFASTYGRDHEAARLLRLLVTSGADVGAVTSGGETALHLAALVGDPLTTSVLLTLGADARRVDAGGRGPLHLACTPLLLAPEAQRTRTVRLLLSSGADPSARDGQGRTPLHVLLTRSDSRLGPDLDLVRLLLQQPTSDPNQLLPGGEHPLLVALGRELWGVASVLVERGADPNAAAPTPLDGGSTPLHLACRAGHAGLVGDLLAKGGDPLVLDRRGFSPLRCAVESGSVETVEACLNSALSAWRPESADPGPDQLPACPPQAWVGVGDDRLAARVSSPFLLAFLTAQPRVLARLFLAGCFSFSELYALRRVCASLPRDQVGARHAKAVRLVEEVSQSPPSLQRLCGWTISRRIGFGAGRKARVCSLGLSGVLGQFILSVNGA